MHKKYRKNIAISSDIAIFSDVSKRCNILLSRYIAIQNAQPWWGHFLVKNSHCKFSFICIKNLSSLKNAELRVYSCVRSGTQVVKIKAQGRIIFDNWQDQRCSWEVTKCFSVAASCSNKVVPAVTLAWNEGNYPKKWRMMVVRAHPGLGRKPYYGRQPHTGLPLDRASTAQS